jgi:hypothetical protein
MLPPDGWPYENRLDSRRPGGLAGPSHLARTHAAQNFVARYVFASRAARTSSRPTSLRTPGHFSSRVAAEVADWAQEQLNLHTSISVLGM